MQKRFSQLVSETFDTRSTLGEKKEKRGNRRKHSVFINYIRNTVVASTVAEFRKAAFYARPNVPSVAVVAFGSLG